MKRDFYLKNKKVSRSYEVRLPLRKKKKTTKVAFMKSAFPKCNFLFWLIYIFGVAPYR